MDTPTPPPPQSPDAPPKIVGRVSPIVQALEAGEFEEPPSRLREFVLPLLLLIGGAIVALVLWLTAFESASTSLVLAGGAVAVQLVVLAPLLFLSLLLMANWFDLSFGTIGPVVFKVIAVTLGVAAIADALLVITLHRADFDWSLIVAGFGYYLVLCGLPLGLLFAMGIYECAMAVFLMFIPRAALAYLLMLACPQLFPTM